MKFPTYHKHLFLVAVVAVFVVSMITSGVLFFGQSDVSAAPGTFSAPAELEGYIWSATQNASDGSRQGLGWISLNCANEGECGSSDYKVVVNPDKTVTGYAWIGGSTDPVGNDITGGFVRFGNLAGCPGTGSCDARVVGNNASGFEFSGWARACTVFQSGCSGALKSNDERGGWDGWISLNCTNHGGCAASNYKVKISNDGNFPSDSNAWGADVLGRLNFSFATINEPCIEGNSCTTDYLAIEYTNMWCETDAPIACTGENTCNPGTAACEPPPVIGGEITFDPQLIRKSQRAVIGWTVDSPVDRCRVEGSNGDTYEPETGDPDEFETQAIATNVTTYTLYCIPDGGGAEVEVTSAELRAIASTYES